MGLRELKERAHQLFVRGKFARCAQTYQEILRLAPKDPNMHVRHAEACRRAGDRLQAIASYRAAAELLLELGCESRARGALKAALELEPRNRLLQEAIARLESHAEEPFPPGAGSGRGGLEVPPPLESGLDPVAPPPPSFTRLPPIQRQQPAARPTPLPRPPVLRPTPARATPIPASHPAPAAAPAPPGGTHPRLEVRRLSPGALAFRCSPQDSWAVIRSHTPLELHLVEDLEKLPPLMRDLPAGRLATSEEESAPGTVH